MLAASVALLFVPTMLLSFFSPFAVRLLPSDAQHGGAPLCLMCILGSRAIMLSFAATVMVYGFAQIALRMRARGWHRTPS